MLSNSEEISNAVKKLFLTKISLQFERAFQS